MYCKKCNEDKSDIYFKIDKGDVCIACQYNIQKKSKNCFKCKKPISKHRRCKKCTILLHTEEKYCEDCLEKYIKVDIC